MSNLHRKLDIGSKESNVSVFLPFSSSGFNVNEGERKTQIYITYKCRIQMQK